MNFRTMNFSSKEKLILWSKHLWLGFWSKELGTLRKIDTLAARILGDEIQGGCIHFWGPNPLMVRKDPVPFIVLNRALTRSEGVGG